MREKKRERITIAIIFILTAVFCILQPFYAVNNILADSVYQRPSVCNSKIKIIRIDEKTMEEYGPTGEWSRDIPAQLVEILYESEEFQPAVLAFDVMYIGEKDSEGDERFAEAVSHADHVLTSANIVYKTAVERDEDGKAYVNEFAVQQLELPYGKLREAGSYAFANTIQDRDGYVRQTQLMAETDEGSIPSVAYEIYRIYQESVGEEVHTPLVDALNRTEFTFSGKSGGYESVSLCDVLSGKIDARVFKDCIVLVGAYAPGLQDSFNVAVQRGEQMYGVEIHANIVQALLEDKFSQPANRFLAGLVMAVAAVLFYLLIRKRNIGVAVGALVVFTGAEIGIGILLRQLGYTIALIHLPIMLILIFIYHVFGKYLIERMNRRKTLNAFKKYVAPQIVEELSRKNDLEIKLGGEKRDIAVLFVDIRGFTTMSESLEPEQVVEILNEYLELTSNAIFNNNGTLDKFVGDATMAVFNAPFALDDYIFRAVKAAWDIAAGGDALEQRMMEKYGKTVGFGVGVNCGAAVVGNIGCNMRMDYTAIGDTVNTAARLESNAKKGQILISQDVYDAVSDRIEAEPIGEIPLKGKSKSVMVYSVTKITGTLRQADTLA